MDRRVVPAAFMFRLMAGNRDKDGMLFHDAFTGCSCGGAVDYFLVEVPSTRKPGNVNVNVNVAPRCEACAAADVASGAMRPAD